MARVVVLRWVLVMTEDGIIGFVVIGFVVVFVDGVSCFVMASANTFLCTTSVSFLLVVVSVVVSVSVWEV